ncbi:cell wall integrity and stress response component 1-like [Colletes gigas]|uniref:cell wall integrity and stress response component 1-like n=1 Tax=Colletes gigas TaxID=935657 RepID=UPI001C9AC6CD|nr:cell wall integrity and stress response component 1-like [Colletes gigas]
MSHFVPWIALLILIGSVRSQEVLLQGKIDVNTPRFGFNILEPIRHAFCVNFCDSTDDTEYIMNLACAIKCPELYLPHGSTNPTSTTSSSSSMSPTSSSTPSSTTSTSTTQSTPSSSSAIPSTMMM